MRGGIKGDLMRRKKEERIRKKEKGRNEEGGDIMEEVRYGSERGCRTEKEGRKERRWEGIDSLIDNARLPKDKMFCLNNCYLLKNEQF